MALAEFTGWLVMQNDEAGRLMDMDAVELAETMKGLKKMIRAYCVMMKIAQIRYPVKDTGQVRRLRPSLTGYRICASMRPSAGRLVPAFRHAFHCLVVKGLLEEKESRSAMSY